MFSLHHGDCLDVLKTFEDNSVDSIVTDPPYGILMMGRKWDASVPSVAIWAECLRVLKPGGHLLAFAGTRTQHRMAVNIEDAGFEIRDMMGWVYGSGFPKSHSISIAIDKAAGVEREVLSETFRGFNAGKSSGICGETVSRTDKVTAHATPEAQQRDGWGSALKPAIEPITVARKPFNGTVSDTVLRWGTGGINVDACRVGIESRWNPSAGNKNLENRHTVTPVSSHKEFDGRECNGRWPANLIHDGSDEVVALFPETSGSNKGPTPADFSPGAATNFIKYAYKSGAHHGDSGSAARFFYAAPPDSDELPIDSADPIFYCAKASKRDRNEGLDGTLTVKYNIDKSILFLDGDLSWKDVSTALAESLKKVTFGSTLRWGIGENGESITGLCLKDSLSTTLTAISKITASEILPLLMRSLTRESTLGVSCETESGGNHAENAESLSQYHLNTTPERTGFHHGARVAVSEMLSIISEKENWRPSNNIHSTVKPTSLMRYLCRLVTPPNGVILDPFCGSGSTGKGAIREGFRFIGIDLSEEYLDIARRRITLAMSQVGIDAETAEPHWAAAPSAEPQPQQIEIAGIIPPAPKQGRLF
jgi:tRNA G10  N-methylase Trm11